MTRRDAVRLLAVLDTLEAPPWDTTRLRVEAILVAARAAAEREERGIARLRSN